MDGGQTWTTADYTHYTTIQHILTHISTISISPTNHNLFLDDDSNPPTINLIYTHNSELFHETIYPNAIVYTHKLFTIARLNLLHHLVLLHNATPKRIHRSAGDTTLQKTLPDQTDSDRRIVVAVSYTDLTVIIIMYCFISRTFKTTSYCNCHAIRRTELARTYVHHFLFTLACILKLLDTNIILTHTPTLSYDKRTSNS